MKTHDEFKQETLRRADALRRKDAHRKRLLTTYLSSAACFVLVVGVMLGIGPILSGAMAEDALPNDRTPTGDIQNHNNLSTSSTPAPGSTGPSREDDYSQGGKTQTSPLYTTNSFATVCDSSTVAPAPTPQFEMQILNHTPPIVSETPICLLLESYESYRSSPYFAEGAIAEEEFDGSTVYLILCPAPVGWVDVAITTQQGETHNVLLSATTYTEDSGYCAKFLVCTEPFAKIDFAIYIN